MGHCATPRHGIFLHIVTVACSNRESAFAQHAVDVH
jgi:hypothetical protein